jgi:hypothetical protein
LSICPTLAASRPLILCHLLSLSSREGSPADRFDLVDFLRPLRLRGSSSMALREIHPPPLSLIDPARYCWAMVFLSK